MRTLSRDVTGKLREREVTGCDFPGERCELAVVRKVHNRFSLVSLK